MRTRACREGRMLWCWTTVMHRLKNNRIRQQLQRGGTHVQLSNTAACHRKWKNTHSFCTKRLFAKKILKNNLRKGRVRGSRSPVLPFPHSKCQSCKRRWLLCVLRQTLGICWTCVGGSLLASPGAGSLFFFGDELCTRNPPFNKPCFFFSLFCFCFYLLLKSFSYGLR